MHHYSTNSDIMGDALGSQIVNCITNLNISIHLTKASQDPKLMFNNLLHSMSSLHETAYMYKLPKILINMLVSGLDLK